MICALLVEIFSTNVLSNFVGSIYVRGGLQASLRWHLLVSAERLERIWSDGINVPLAVFEIKTTRLMDRTLRLES